MNILGLAVQFVEIQLLFCIYNASEFNRTYRQVVLDVHLFEEISKVRILTQEWIKDYNQERPNEGLGGMTPNAYEQEYAIPDLSCCDKMWQ